MKGKFYENGKLTAAIVGMGFGKEHLAKILCLNLHFIRIIRELS